MLSFTLALLHFSIAPPAARLRVSAIVQELAESLADFDSLVTGQVLPVLKILVEDDDLDVRFFAGQALLNFKE